MDQDSDLLPQLISSIYKIPMPSQDLIRIICADNREGETCVFTLGYLSKVFEQMRENSSHITEDQENHLRFIEFMESVAKVSMRAGALLEREQNTAKMIALAEKAMYKENTKTDLPLN